MPGFHLTYDELAIRDGEPYLVIVHYDNGLSNVIPQRTLSEALWLMPSSNSITELAVVEEVAEGVPVRTSLAWNVAGVWFFCNQKELNMAKVKTNGGGRDVESDLLGVSKPRGKKQMEAQKAVGRQGARGAKQTAERAPRQPRVVFEDHQRIKKIGDRNTRPESNVGKVIAMIRPNMTFAEFTRTLEKSKIPFKPAGILSFLVKDGVVSVK